MDNPVRVSAQQTQEELLIAVEQFKLGLMAKATGEAMSDQDYRRLHAIILAHPSLVQRLPRFIHTCRTPSEFWHFIKAEVEGYQPRRDYLASVFNPLLEDIEAGRLPGTDIVEIDAKVEASNPLDQQFIEEQIQKCRAKLSAADYDGAITNARSLVEAVLREMERRLGDANPPTDGDLVRQYSRVIKLLNLDPNKEGLDAPFLPILRGLVSMVHGLSHLRNTASDAHARNYRPEPHHARLAVNSAKTLVDFVFETYDYQKRTGKLEAKQRVVPTA
jgi:hypothetical protein